MNAQAVSEVEDENLLAWDCGAGSYQISSKSNHFSDAHGSGTVLKAALQLLKRGDSMTPNPFTPEDIQELLWYLDKNLKSVPNWILDPKN